jgi:hypothetical protein
VAVERSQSTLMMRCSASVRLDEGFRATSEP